jgi:hypothetical protein
MKRLIPGSPLLIVRLAMLSESGTLAHRTHLQKRPGMRDTTVTGTYSPDVR